MEIKEEKIHKNLKFIDRCVLFDCKNLRILNKIILFHFRLTQ